MYFETQVIFTEEIPTKNGVKEKRTRRNFLVECDSVSVAEAKVNAEIKRIEKTADSEINYDIEALKQQQYSYKDEFALLVITMPFIGSFLPWTQEYVMLGWEYVSNAPEWYSYTFIGAISASLGIRWATKMLGKK